MQEGLGKSILAARPPAARLIHFPVMADERNSRWKPPYSSLSRCASPLSYGDRRAAAGHETMQTIQRFMSPQASTAGATVPEPSTWAMLRMGFVGLGVPPDPSPKTSDEATAIIIILRSDN
jgi:hypothetical protein